MFNATKTSGPFLGGRGATKLALNEFWYACSLSDCISHSAVIIQTYHEIPDYRCSGRTERFTLEWTNRLRGMPEEGRYCLEWRGLAMRKRSPGSQKYKPCSMKCWVLSVVHIPLRSTISPWRQNQRSGKKGEEGMLAETGSQWPSSSITTTHPNNVNLVERRSPVGDLEKQMSRLFGELEQRLRTVIIFGRCVSSRVFMPLCIASTLPNAYQTKPKKQKDVSMHILKGGRS